jgi:hypothetical protein
MVALQTALRSERPRAARTSTTYWAFDAVAASCDKVFSFKRALHSWGVSFGRRGNLSNGCAPFAERFQSGRVQIGQSATAASAPSPFAHVPSSQLPDAQTLPQSPQLLGSAARSAGLPMQHDGCSPKP